MRTILVSPSDISLFHVAARELGAAKDWIRIAQANGIVDPMIRASGTLRIPTDGQPSSTGLPDVALPPVVL